MISRSYCSSLLYKTSPWLFIFKYHHHWNLLHQIYQTLHHSIISSTLIPIFLMSTIVTIVFRAGLFLYAYIERGWGREDDNFENSSHFKIVHPLCPTIYIYIYIYIYTHTRTHTQIYMCVCVCICVLVCLYQIDRYGHTDLDRGINK